MLQDESCAKVVRSTTGAPEDGFERMSRDEASWMRAECQGEARRLSSRALFLPDSGGTARRRHDDYTKLDAVAAGGLSRYGDFSLPSG